MGTIESIESEKSKLNRYFHDKYFPIFHIDEFTGEDAYCFRSGNFLTDTRVDDVDFKGLTENETKNIRKSSARDNNFTAELKSLMSGIGTKIGEEYVGTPKYEILEDLIENDIKMAKEEATHLSRIESFLIGSSSNGKITYKIEVVFQNVSHQRLMSNFKFLIITPDNKRFGLGENDIVSITHQITSEGVWDIFSDTVILNVPIDVAERGVVNKSKISIRFDGLDIRTSLAFPFGSYPAKSFRLIKDDSLSDEEVDDLYDDYQEILELQEKESERLKREREEREAALEEEQKRKSFEDKLLSKVDAIGNLNLKDFNTLKKLLNTPFKIKEIQELDNFCKSNRIQSSVLEYIMSLKELGNKDTILNDILLLSKKSQDKAKSKLYSKYVAVLCIITIIAGPILTENYNSGSPLDSLVAIIFLVLVVAFFVLRRRSKSELTVGPDAARFIEEFSTNLSSRGKIYISGE